MGNGHTREHFWDCGGQQYTSKDKDRHGQNGMQCYNEDDEEVSESENDFDEAYEVDSGKILGQGKFSVVRACWRRGHPSKKYALKEILTCQADSSSISRIREEINVLRVLGGHPGIIQLVDTNDSSSDRFRIIMDLCEGGELYDRIQQLKMYTEWEARLCVGNLVNAVAYIHGKGIMHRDLKPENILLVGASNTDIKISDFGLARMSKDFPARFPRATSICGSDFYLAPEVIKQEEYGREIDVWALGVITYCVLSGSLPFFNSVLHKLYRQIVERDIGFPDTPWRNVSKGGVDFVLRLLRVQPGERPTMDAALSHPWIAEAKHALPRAALSDASSLGIGASFPTEIPGRLGSAANPLRRAEPSQHIVRPMGTR